MSWYPQPQIYSMIFKTFESDIDKISAKWGIFGKSFNDIGNAIVGRIKDINKGFQATDDLIGSIKNSDSVWKRLYPSKETIQSQMIDIDALYPEKTDAQFTKLLSTLTQQQDLINTTKGSWTEYFKNLGEGEKWQIEFVQNTDLQKASLDDVKKAYNSARDAAIAHNAALKQQTLGAKAASVAMKALSVAGNMLVFWGISKVAEGITWAYKQISGKAAEEAKQKIKELGEEAQSSIDSITSSLEENTKTINDVKQKYAELAQGINNLGKVSQNQGTLSNDEYSEFLDISNQLAELFPQLTVGYDDNGNAILNLSGNVGTITSQLNDLINTEKELAAQQIRNDIGATWDAFGENIEESENKISSLEETIKTYSNALSEFQKISSGGQVYMNSSSIDQYAEAFKAVGIIKSDANFFDKKDNEYLLEARNSDELMGIDFSKLSKTQKDKIEGYLKQTVQSYNTQLEAAQNELVNRNKEFSTNVIASVMDSDAYQNTDNKSIIDTILTNYDYTQLYKDFDGNWENAYNYLYNQIIGAFDGQNGKEIQNIWNNLLSIDTDAALAENIPKIEAYIKQLAELLNIDWTQLAPALGYDLEAYKQKIKTAKERLGFNYSTDARDRQNSSIQEKNRKINELTQGLTDEEWEILADVDIPDDVLDYSAEKFREWIAEQNENAVIETKIRTSTDAVDSFEETKKALSSLDDLYSQTVLKNASGDGIANGFASPDTINAVESAFGGIAEEDAKVASALQEFEETLVKFPNDSEKAQDAINNLVTAYIDQTDILQDLTEEKKEWAKAQLKAMGITNAEEVVESRLNQQIKKNIEAFGKYKESVADYSKKLSTLDNADEGYSDALEGMRAGFEELFNSMNQFKDENGEVITVPISTEFAQNNLEDLMAAANGSTEALDRLQVAATADYMIQCGINVPSEAKDGLRTQMNSLISQIQSEVKDVKVGAYLNNSQAVSALVQLAKQAGLSSKEVNNALSSIGVSPTVSYINMDVPDLEENIKTYNGHPVFGGYKVKSYKQVKLPVVKYSKTSGGTSTGAIYGGGSGGSSSGGSGGGGGGGSDTQKDPDTVDWIETAVQREERTISNLDKTVTNVYDNWSNRNKALSTEIGEVRKEIDLQQRAYQGYINKANSLGLSEEYKQKVYNGAIQIEDIADENLAKKVSEFKQWYEKAIACQDAIQDLNITLGELAQTKFDNVEKQFSYLIDIIEAQADIIDAKISNVEEQGYFASSEFYRKQIEYEQQVLNNLNSEYSSLVAKRNEAVRDGSIIQGSEQYQEMEKSILDVQKSIEESKTSIVELNNAIRDLNWEVFDYAEERISKITNEANFLIDAFSNYDLYNENGTFNDKANATAYLHGKNYEVYLQQSRDYAEEIKKINADLAKDPSNKDLIERREELLDLQQESISNMYAEKNAIKSLVEEGINKHLESLSELIDKYKESLNSAKDLYDYQENISQQTSEISRLQKILQSYEGMDDTEESRKSIQEYQNQLKDAQESLKETQWERFISESEKLLDDLYSDYEETLNARLDNIDTLFTDVINGANANANMINSTIYNMANSIGYSINMLSQSIPSIKGNVFNGIKAYASGTSGVTYKHVAWTQDGGSEIIYRSSDGAILTPLNVGDKVFTHEMSENLWKMAQGNLEGFGANMIKIPDNLGGQARTINNDNMISINLPNVTNYDEFKRDLQKDPKFVGFVQEVTLGQALGRNSLNKNRY